VNYQLADKADLAEMIRMRLKRILGEAASNEDFEKVNGCEFNKMNRRCVTRYFEDQVKDILWALDRIERIN
jgi:hypothetical protein